MSLPFNYVDEYRDPQRIKALVERIHQVATRQHVIMEICGGQTHAIIKNGLDQLLGDTVELIHGPGCPVCVTSQHYIDWAIELSQRDNTVLCSFGDMMRVPGSATDLIGAGAMGGRVEMMYSPLDAVKYAAQHPEQDIVFFAVGFETTAPANAMAVKVAKQQGLKNFSLLAAHVTVPPAIRALMESPDNRVQGFLAAGHVCTIMGMHEYQPLVEAYQIPIVVTGFEPLDVLQGVLLCIEQLEQGIARLDNQYRRSVTFKGNEVAQALLQEVFEPCDQLWRGIGNIPQSGLRLNADYADYDALKKFDLSVGGDETPSVCIAGEILRGIKKPGDCPAFGTQCTPIKPLGAPMVSSEGACSAYYQYRGLA